MAEADWDTVVLGAGVLGCATAYHLKLADPDTLELGASSSPSR